METYGNNEDERAEKMVRDAHKKTIKSTKANLLKGPSDSLKNQQRLSLEAGDAAKKVHVQQE